MVHDDYAKSLLLITAFREARGDGIEAMRGVLHTIMNRAHNWYKGDVVPVVTSPNQFSSMTILGDTQTIIWPSNPRDLEPLMTLVDSIYVGSNPDNTQGSLYYANEARVTSGWYKDTIMGDPVGHPVQIVIGKQTFRK